MAAEVREIIGSTGDEIKLFQEIIDNQSPFWNIGEPFPLIVE